MDAGFGYCFIRSRPYQRYDGKLSPGLKALGELPLAAWVQILGAIAIVELTVGKQDYENKVGSCLDEPGCPGGVAAG